MANKVGPKEQARIFELKEKYGLTAAVIAERLGISRKTVQIYLKSSRSGLPPYTKEVLTSEDVS